MVGSTIAVSGAVLGRLGSFFMVLSILMARSPHLVLLVMVASSLVMVLTQEMARTICLVLS